MEISGNVELIEQCLKSTYNFSERVVYNICTGEMHTIPNGAWDYALCFILSGFGIACIVFIIKMCFDY